MLKVDNSYRSPCATCAYHHTHTTKTVLCMYIVATKQQRGCPVGLCDKYEYATEKEHDAFWKMINNQDNNPFKPNAFTLNHYKYFKRKREREGKDK